MSTPSHSLKSSKATRSGSITIGANPIALLGSDRGLIDFGETRFRVHSLRLQKSIQPLALELAKETSSELCSLAELSSEPEANLRSKTYCAFDFLALNTDNSRGFLRTKWMPFVLFIRGEAVLRMHAAYDESGARITGITMLREDKEEHTRCTSLKAALKVGRSFIRTLNREVT